MPPYQHKHSAWLNIWSIIPPASARPIPNSTNSQTTAKIFIHTKLSHKNSEVKSSLDLSWPKNKVLFSGVSLQAFIFSTLHQNTKCIKWAVQPKWGGKGTAWPLCFQPTSLKYFSISAWAAWYTALFSWFWRSSICSSPPNSSTSKQSFSTSRSCSAA